MKKILVPCDFSEPAVQAFRMAVNMARKSKGEVMLLTVLELPVLYDSAAILKFEEVFMKENKERAVKKFIKLKKKWANNGPKVSMEVLYGGTVTRIRDFITMTKPDLIVIGTHGASGIKEFTIGSNTEKIVRSSPVPVIAIKHAPESVKEIVFPVRPDLDQEELTMKIKDLQDFFGARLHVVYINTPALFKSDLESNAKLQAMAKRFMLKNFTINIFNDRTEEEGIANFAKEVKADMIAMRTHGRRGIAHLAMGSIAEDVVNHISCAVWTFKVK